MLAEPGFFIDRRHPGLPSWSQVIRAVRLPVGSPALEHFLVEGVGPWVEIHIVLDLAVFLHG